jgi:uncharacterized protein Yka (UPF0111/DUF47 family)
MNMTTVGEGELSEQGVEMAKRQKDLLSRMADAGEEALQRLAGTPGADRVLGTALGVLHNMRDQVDSLSKRVRGLEEMEKRVAKLERKVDKMSREAAAATSSSGSRSSTAKSSRSSSSSRSRSSSSAASTKKKS